MKFPYIVHRVSDHPRPRTADIDGEKMAATVMETEVEFIPADADHQGTFVRRFVGAAANEAKELFKQGETITLTIGE